MTFLQFVVNRVYPQVRPVDTLNRCHCHRPTRPPPPSLLKKPQKTTMVKKSLLLFHDASEPQTKGCVVFAVCRSAVVIIGERGSTSPLSFPLRLSSTPPSSGSCCTPDCRDVRQRAGKWVSAMIFKTPCRSSAQQRRSAARRDT